jgi:hypothetical protein
MLLICEVRWSKNRVVTQQVGLSAIEREEQKSWLVHQAYSTFRFSWRCRELLAEDTPREAATRIAVYAT